MAAALSVLLVPSTAWALPSPIIFVFAGDLLLQLGLVALLIVPQGLRFLRERLRRVLPSWQLRLAALAHGIPAGLMLPVVIAAAQHQPVLGPDDLRADVETGGNQTVGHSRCVEGAMPNIGHVAGK